MSRLPGSFLLCILLLLPCCKEPGTVYQFRKKAPSYSFCLDFSDSTAAYDISFTTRVDSPRKEHLSSRISHRMDISFLNETAAPDTLFSESVYADFGTGAGLVIPYRSALKPPFPGIWRMDVKVEDEPEGFRGLGVIVRKRNGTR